MKFDLVLNSKSGSRSLVDTEGQEQLRALFEEVGHTVDLAVVAPEELQESLRIAVESDSSAVIVGGGDGTVALAAEMLMGRDKPLGILPLGTFNLAARAADVPLEPMESLRALLSADEQEIDVLRVNDKVCLCLTVLGFYPHLANAREGFRGRPWWAKTFRILYEMCVLAVRTPVLDLKIQTAEEAVSVRTRLASFCPGPYEESIGLLAKRAKLDGGRMIAYVMDGVGRWQLIKAGLGYLAGRLMEVDELRSIEGDSMVLSVKRRKKVKAMIDGEILSLEMPCEMVLKKRALRILHPCEDSEAARKENTSPV